MNNYRALVVRYKRKAHNYRERMIFAAILICIRVLLNWRNFNVWARSSWMNKG